MANPWSVLGLEPTEDLAQVRRAYARLVRLYHPEDHPEKYQEIAQAYQLILSQIRRGRIFKEEQPPEADSVAEMGAASEADAELPGFEEEQSLAAGPEQELDRASTGQSALDFEGWEKGQETAQSAHDSQSSWQDFLQPGPSFQEQILVGSSADLDFSEAAPSVNRYEIERDFYQLLAYRAHDILAWKKLFEEREHYQILLELLEREDVVILTEMSFIRLVKSFIEYHEEDPNQLPYYQRLILWQDFYQRWPHNRQKLVDNRVSAFEAYLENTAFTQKLLDNPNLFQDWEAWDSFYNYHNSRMNYYSWDRLLTCLYHRRKEIFEPEIIRRFLTASRHLSGEETEEQRLQEDALADWLLEMEEERADYVYDDFLTRFLHPLLGLLTLLALAWHLWSAWTDRSLSAAVLTCLGAYFLYYQYHFHKAMRKQALLDGWDFLCLYASGLLYIGTAFWGAREASQTWLLLIGLATSYFFFKVYRDFDRNSWLPWTNIAVFSLSGAFFYLIKLENSLQPSIDQSDLPYLIPSLIFLILPVVIIAWLLLPSPKQFGLFYLPGLLGCILLVYGSGLLGGEGWLLYDYQQAGLANFFFFPLVNSFYLVYQRPTFRESYYCSISYWQNLLIVAYGFLILGTSYLQGLPLSEAGLPEKAFFLLGLELVFWLTRLVIVSMTNSLKQQGKLPSRFMRDLPKIFSQN